MTERGVCILIGGVLAWLIHLAVDRPRTVVETRTEVRVDTLVVERPVVRDSLVVRYKIVRAPLALAAEPQGAVADSSALTADAVSTVALSLDSVEVSLPITQKHYADSLYDAWVSGYDPSLDSIRIYSPVTTIYQQERRKRLGWGVSAGVAVTPKGVQPYVGVGVTLGL